MLDPNTNLPKENKDPRELLLKAIETQKRVDLEPRPVKGVFGDYGNIAVTSERNFNEIRAQNQSGLELFGKGLLQSVTTVGGMAIEGAGYLLQTPATILSVLNDSKDVFERNMIAELGSSIQEFGQEIAPIYQTEKAQSGTFGRFADPTFIAQSAPSILSTVGMMFPSFAVARGLGALAGAMRISGLATKGLTTIGAALANTHLENMMEGTRYFDERRKELLSEGVSEEEADRSASIGASQLYKGAFVTNAILNSLQWGSILKPYDFANRSLKSSVVDIVDDGSVPMLTMIRNTLKSNPKLSVKNAIKKNKESLPLQSLVEGLEEFNMEFARHLADRNIKAIESGRPEDVKGVLESYFSSDMLDVAADPMAQDAFVFGMIGGAGFGAASRIGNRRSIQKQQEEGLRQAQLFKKRSEKIAENFKKQMEAVAEGDEIKLEEARYQAIQEMAINGFVDPQTKDRYVGAIEDGTFGNIVEMYEAAEQLTDEEISELGLGDDAAKVREAARLTVSELNKVAEIYNRLADKNFGTERDDVVRAYTAEQEYINDYTERIIGKYQSKIDELKQDQRYKSEAEDMTSRELLYAERKRKQTQIELIRKGLIDIQNGVEKKVERYGYLYAANSAIPERSIQRTIKEIDKELSELDGLLKDDEGVDGLTKTMQQRAEQFNKNILSSFSDLTTAEMKLSGRRYKLVEGKAFLNEFYKQPNLREFVRNVQRGEEELRKTLFRFSVDESTKESPFAIINGASYKVQRSGDNYIAKLVDRNLDEVQETVLTDDQQRLNKDIDTQLEQEKKSLNEKDGSWYATIIEKDSNKVLESANNISKLEEERSQKLEQSLSEDEQQAINDEYDVLVAKERDKAIGETKTRKLDAKTKEEAESILDEMAQDKKKAILPPEYFSERELLFENIDELKSLSESEFYNPKLILTEDQFKEKRDKFNDLVLNEKYVEAAKLMQEELEKSNYFDKSRSLFNEFFDSIFQNIQNKNSIRELDKLIVDAEPVFESYQGLKIAAMIRRGDLNQERKKQLLAFNKVAAKKKKELDELSKKIRSMKKSLERLSQEDIDLDMPISDLIEALGSESNVIEHFESIKRFLSDKSKTLREILDGVKEETERLSLLEKELKDSQKAIKRLEESFQNEIPLVLLESDALRLDDEMSSLRALSLYKFSFTSRSLANLQRKVSRAKEEMSVVEMSVTEMLKRIQSLENATDESVKAAKKAFDYLKRTNPSLFKISDENMIPVALEKFINRYNKEITLIIQSKKSESVRKDLQRLRITKANKFNRAEMIESIDGLAYLNLLEQKAIEVRRLLYSQDDYNNFYDLIKTEAARIQEDPEAIEELSNLAEFAPKRDPDKVFSVLSGNYGSAEYGLTSDESQARYGRWITKTNISNSLDQYNIKIVRASDVGIEVPQKVLDQYKGREQYILFAVVVNEDGKYYTENNEVTDSFDPNSSIYTSVPQASYFVNDVSKTYVLEKSEDGGSVIVATSEQLKKLYPPKKGEPFSESSARAQLQNDLRRYREEHQSFLDDIVSKIEGGEDVILPVYGKTNGVQAEDRSITEEYGVSVKDVFGEGLENISMVVPSSNEYSINGVKYSVIPGLPLLVDKITGNVFRAYTKTLSEDDINTAVNSFSQVAKTVSKVKSKIGKKTVESYRFDADQSKPFFEVIKSLTWFSSTSGKNVKAPIRIQRSSSKGKRISRPQIYIEGVGAIDLVEVNQNDGTLTGNLNPKAEQAIRSYLSGKRLKINLNRNEDGQRVGISYEFRKRSVNEKGQISEKKYEGGYIDYLVSENRIYLKQELAKNIDRVVERDGIEVSIKSGTVTHYSQNLIFKNNFSEENREMVPSSLDQEMFDIIRTEEVVPDHIQEEILLKIERKQALSSLEKIVFETYMGGEVGSTVGTIDASAPEFRGSEIFISAYPTEEEKKDTSNGSMYSDYLQSASVYRRSTQSPNATEKEVEDYVILATAGWTIERRINESDIDEYDKQRLLEEFDSFRKRKVIGKTKKGEEKLEGDDSYYARVNPSSMVSYVVGFLKSNGLITESEYAEFINQKQELKKAPEVTSEGTTEEIDPDLAEELEKIAQEELASMRSEDKKDKKDSLDIKHDSDEWDFQLVPYGRTIPINDLNSQISKISKRIGVKIKVLDEVQAKKLIKKITGKDINRRVYGFSYNGVAYVVGRDEFQGDTLFHEVAHPIVSEILKENPYLFDRLFDELKSSPTGNQIIAEVEESYSELNQGYPKGVYSTQMKAEIIVTAIGRDAADLVYGNANKTLRQRIAEIWDAILDYFRIKLGMKITPAQLNKRSTVRDIARLIATRKVDVSVQEVSDNVLNLQKGEQTIKEGVPELFESNPELANSLYEAAGFKSAISIPNYEVVTRPTKNIGKSKGRSGNFVEITTPDDYRTNMSAYMVQTNDDGKLFINNIEKYNEDSTFKGFGTVAYVDFFENYKNQGITTDKKLTTDGIKLLERLEKIGLVYKTDAKLIDDSQVSRILKTKIYEYNKPLYEFNLNWSRNEITPQQKQQTQQLYSQYVEQSGKQDIEGFKEFVKSEAPITPTPEVNLETLGVTESEWSLLTKEEKDMIQQQYKICK